MGGGWGTISDQSKKTMVTCTYPPLTFHPSPLWSMALVKNMGEKWITADRKHRCILICENYLSNTRALNVLRNHQQPLPNESADGEQAIEHYLECQNLIHWHFLPVQTPLHGGPDYKNIVMMRYLDKIISLFPSNFFLFPLLTILKRSWIHINKWKSSTMVGSMPK